MNAQDAVLAAEAGVDGILISNHGGKLVCQPSLLLFDGQYSRPSARIVSGDSHRLATLQRADIRTSSLPSIEVLYRLRMERPDVFRRTEGE